MCPHNVDDIDIIDNSPYSDFSDLVEEVANLEDIFKRNPRLSDQFLEQKSTLIQSKFFALLQDEN